MNFLKSFESENELFKSYISESVAVIKVINNPFEKITNVEWNNKVIDLLNFAEKEISIHSVLFITELEYCKEIYYDQFLNSIFNDAQSDDKLPQPKSSQNRDERIRQINLLDRLIINLSQFSKLTIFALHGDVVTPFIGLSLTADFRICSDNLKLMFSHAKHGVHPTGALPFFLKQYFSPSLYKKYLFEGGNINSEAAKEYNLVNKVINESDFEKQSVKYAKEISKINLNVVRSTKRLLNQSEELKKYFENESSLFFS